MTCGPHPLLIHNPVHPNTEPRPPIQVQASVCTQPPPSKTQTQSMHSHYSPPAAVYLIHDPAVIRQSPADSFLAYGDTSSKRKYIVFKDIFLTANMSQSLTYPSKKFFLLYYAAYVLTYISTKLNIWMDLCIELVQLEACAIRCMQDDIHFTCVQLLQRGSLRGCRET